MSHSQYLTLILALLLAAVVVGPQSAWGSEDEAPAWARVPPAADIKYKYYVGVGWDHQSQATAQELAIRDAQESAIRENFGVVTKIDVDNYRTLKETSFNQRLSEASSPIQLLEFERRQVSVAQSRRGGFVVWVLFRYPLKEIEREKIRLEGAQPPPGGIGVRTGSARLKHNTLLVVTSVPEGIEIYIDEVRWGVTPLTLKGVLPAGKHRLWLTDPEFEDARSEVNLVEHDSREVHHVLKSAQGELTVTSNLNSAKIYVDGKLKGKASVGPLRLDAGRPHVVLVEHKDAESQSQEITLAKGEIRYWRAELRKRMAFVRATAGQDLTMVYVNRNFRSYIERKPTQFEVEPDEEIELRIEAINHRPTFKSLRLRPGQVYDLGHIELERQPEENPSYARSVGSSSDSDSSWSSSSQLWPDAEWYQKSVVFSFFVSYNDRSLDADWAANSFGFGFFLEQRFLYRLGLRGGLEIISGDDPDLEYEMRGENWSLGIPLYLEDSASSYYIIYEIGGTRQDYDKDSITVAEVSQRRAGLGIGVIGVPNGGNLSLTAYRYDMGAWGSHNGLSLQVGFTIGSGER